MSPVIAHACFSMGIPMFTMSTGSFFYSLKEEPENQLNLAFYGLVSYKTLVTMNTQYKTLYIKNKYHRLALFTSPLYSIVAGGLGIYENTKNNNPNNQ
jgi:hypothetical protein